jgi:tetratricopeptide (TPR) repeat protein
LVAALGGWWWIAGLLSTPASDPDLGASAEVLEQARSRLGAGDFQQARQLYHQALELQTAARYTHAAASTWEELGALEQGAQRWAAARAAYAHAVRSYAGLQERVGQARVLRRLAALEFHTGRYRSRWTLEQALSVQEPGDPLAGAS